MWRMTQQALTVRPLRQERMLVSIIATRDAALEDLGARGIAHVTRGKEGIENKHSTDVESTSRVRASV